MDEDTVDLLVTVVLAADDERAARRACQELQWHVDGRIVESADCSAEEPGCWSVTMRVPTEERATHQVAAPLARAVRVFVRTLGPAFGNPRVACEPPTAWIVLDDPEALGGLVTGAERMLVEAWYGGDPYPRPEAAEPDWPAEDESPSPDAPSTGSSEGSRPQSVARQAKSPDRTPDPNGPADRLRLRVDVATDRASGAEWQARALASRVSGTATLTEVSEADGVVSVHVDLGPAPAAAADAVRAAAGALDRVGWSELSWTGPVASTSWIAQPRPATGITALVLSSGPETNQRKQ
ncbi:MAG TPA: hypothetical protein VG756_20990 [Pseudonocardiaceae bacterium]|nr:hypothetical protein [Pseudonocardiaceae bacterium]